MSQRGSVRKRGSTWTAYWFVPDAKGERRQRTKGGFEKKRDAQGYLNEQLAGIADSNYIEPSRLTLGEYLTDYWLPTVKSGTRPSTWDSYRRTIEQHIIPALGGTHLQQLSAHQLDRFYADKLTSGRVSVLVATDVAARGIHVDDISLVIQADAPDEYKAYLHRSGRTGRAGTVGTVVTLVTRQRRRRLEELLVRAEIQAVTHEVRAGDALLDQLAAL